MGPNPRTYATFNFIRGISPRRKGLVSDFIGEGVRVETYLTVVRGLAENRGRGKGVARGGVIRRDFDPGAGDTISMMRKEKMLAGECFDDLMCASWYFLSFKVFW
ncbi:hypothetical protein N7461_006829 [Penicillium sp. DV-2018c]|nr:hypothetical protein N7461_006829 [Penicillium sp. DV-2018c]